MIYIDTSCLIKLLVREPESASVRELVNREDTVIVSSLAELEAEIQLKAGYLGGQFRASQWREHLSKLAALRNFQPFRFVSLGGAIFQTALRQNRRAGEIHCRTMDRLHLGAMEELGSRRIMTNDDPQATAARDLGFEVVLPARS